MDEEFIAAYHGLLANKFILPTVGIVEVISGLFLIIGRYVVVALTAMIPITVGIIGFHLSVDVEGIFPGLLVGGMLLYLIHSNRKLINEFINKVDLV